MTSPNEILKAKTLVLPVRHYDERVACEAIEMEEGAVEYEILNKKFENGVFKVSYRALPKSDWNLVSSLPASKRPLVPEREKIKKRIHRSRLIEAAALGVAAFILIAQVSILSVQIHSLWNYNVRLSQMGASGAALSTPAASTRQEHWVKQLNQLAESLSQVGGSIDYFEFTTRGNLLKVSLPPGRKVDVESLLSTTLSRQVVQLKEGLWSWQD